MAEAEASSQAADGAARKRRRWLRRAAWAAGAALALLVLLAVAVPPLLPASWVGRLVAGQIGRRLGREVAVEGARVSLFAGLHAWGILVRERPGFGDADFVRVPELRSGWPWSASIMISDGADVSLVRNEQGLLNTHDLLERPPGDLRYSRLALSNLCVRYTDLGTGGAAAVTLSSVHIGPPNGGKRPVRLGARLATGGTAMAVGDAWVTRAGDFDHAKLSLAAQSVALGRLAAALRPRHAVPEELAGLFLDADFEVEVRSERILRGRGTARLTGLPEAPWLGLDGPERAIVATLSGELSALNPHFDLAVAAQPGDSARLTASLKQIVDDGSVPSFSADNYLLEVRGTARADFARGGLRGTALVAGRGRLDAELSGTLARAKVTVRSALEDGEVALDADARGALPPVTFEMDGGFSLRELSAQLSRLAFVAEGASVTGDGGVRPAEGAKVAIAADGSLPPMAGGARLVADADFARWPAALRVLAGLPKGKPAAGTAKAAWHLLVAGHECRHTLHVEADRVPLDQDIWLLDRLPILNIVNAIVGGKPDALRFVAGVTGDLTARGTSPSQVRETLAGGGDVRLTQLRISGSPLLRLLAGWSGRPELRALAFERADAPFTVAAGRVESTVTLPSGGGALILKGHSQFTGELSYALRVRNAAEVPIIPRALVDYLEAGLPLMHVTGTAEVPVARIPAEAILGFNLKQKLR